MNPTHTSFQDAAPPTDPDPGLPRPLPRSGTAGPDTALRLDASLDRTAAPALQRELRDRLERSSALAVDGYDVERISTACLQVLVAAASGTRALGGSFRICTPSAALGAAIRDLALGRALGMDIG